MKITTRLLLEILAIVFIITLAAFFRLYQLDDIPPGLYADVAANGLDGIGVLQGDFQIFYSRNAGREGLFYWLMAPFLLISEQYWMLYLYTAVIGIATVALHYFVVRKLFGRWVGFIATFLLATSFFHVHYSRLGYRTILAPIFILLTLYTTKRLLERNNKFWAIASGVSLGLGMYTYLSMRAFLLAVPLALVWYFYWNKKAWKKLKGNIKTAGIALGVTLLPLIAGMIEDPASAFSRSGQVVNENIFVSIWKTILIFGFKGDTETQYNFGELPLITPILTLFFIIGIVYLIREKRWKSFTTAFIALTLASQLAVVAITDRVPHLLRAVSITAVLYIVIAFGIMYTYRILKKDFSNIRIEKFALAPALFIVALILQACSITIATYDTYFNDWANQENLAKGEFFSEYVALGEYLDENYFERAIVVSNYYKNDETRLDTYVLQTADYFIGDPFRRTYEVRCNPGCTAEDWQGPLDDYGLNPEETDFTYFIKSSDFNARKSFEEVFAGKEIVQRDVIFDELSGSEVWVVLEITE